MPVWPETNLEPKRRQQRLRHRGHVAVAVDRREMRGAGRRQRFRAERAPAVFIAHVLQALAIGRLQRRGIGDVGCRIRSAARGLEILLQQTERARKRWTGGEFRRREHLAAAIGNRQRLAQMRAERLEVFDRQRAAGGLDVGGEALRQIALVEVARAGAGELRHRGLEPVLRQADVGLDAPWRIRRQAVHQIGGGARGVTPQDPQPHSKSSAWSTSRPRGLHRRARRSARPIPSTAVWRGGDALPPCRPPRRARRSSRGREYCGRPSPAARGRYRTPRRRRSADNPRAAGSRGARMP